MNAIEIAKEATQKAATALTGKGEAYGFSHDSPQWKVEFGGVLSPEASAACIINEALASLPLSKPWDADRKESFAAWTEATEILEAFATENKIIQYTDL